MTDRVTSTIRRFIAHVTELNRVLAICMDGISHMSASVPLASAVFQLRKERRVRGFDSRVENKRLREFKNRATFGRSETRKGFPVIHAHATVALWGALEAFAEDFVVAHLESEPELLDTHTLSTVRIPLAEFESLQKDERIRLLVREYSRAVKSDLKTGVSKFEVLFDAIGLSGKVDQVLRKTLFECNCVRNVLVHRASVCDRRFSEACPWLGLKPGDRLRITPQRYRQYSEAVMAYATTLVRRAHSHIVRSKRSSRSLTVGSMATVQKRPAHAHAH